MTEKTHFQNNKQFVWDSTSLGILKTCPLKYHLAMREDWVSKSRSVHLDFGTLAHSGRQQFYLAKAEGLSHNQACEAAIYWTAKALQANPLGPQKIKTEFNLLLFLQTYFDRYIDDPCETLILPNGKPAVELSFKLDLGHYMLAGHIDRVVRFDGKLYITDLKTTTSTLNHDYFSQFYPNNQMSLYDYAGCAILPEPPAGIILDAAQILTGGVRLERHFMKRTNSQREEWIADFTHWMRVNEFYHNTDHYPKNDTACNHYGKCAFRDQHCALIPSLREASLQAYFEKRIWNPLDNR